MRPFGSCTLVGPHQYFQQIDAYGREQWRTSQLPRFTLKMALQMTRVCLRLELLSIHSHTYKCNVAISRISSYICQFEIHVSLNILWFCSLLLDTVNYEQFWHVQQIKNCHNRQQVANQASTRKCPLCHMIVCELQVCKTEFCAQCQYNNHWYNTEASKQQLMQWQTHCCRCGKLR